MSHLVVAEVIGVAAWMKSMLWVDLHLCTSPSLQTVEMDALFCVSCAGKKKKKNYARLVEKT